ncbi:hypothetical protein [Paenibacillus xerothermodurans]|nr:hypothetical protein [Paenibacillus xerothermodurans]
MLFKIMEGYARGAVTMANTQECRISAHSEQSRQGGRLLLVAGARRLGGQHEKGMDMFNMPSPFMQLLPLQ